MYLAKFFHRAPGNDDRELMLIPGSEPMVMGVHMNWNGEPGEDQYLREEFSGVADAAAAFRRHVAELVGAGYIETDHTKHSLRDLGPDPQAKPDWQKGLDELMILALSAPMAEQARQIEALKGTPAEREPLYLWHAARRDYAEDDPAQAVRFAEQARDTMRARRAAGQPHYAWSLYENDLEGRILELLSDAYLAADDPEAALKAIEQTVQERPEPRTRPQARRASLRLFPRAAGRSLRRRLSMVLLRRL